MSRIRLPLLRPLVGALFLLSLAACDDSDGGEHPGPVPTNTPIVVLPTWTSAPTSTSVPTSTTIPSATESLPTQTIAATARATSEPSNTAVVTATAVATDTEAPTVTATVEATATATGTATETEVPTVIDTATPSATATASATPTATPTGLQANGSIEQVWIIGAPANSSLELRSSSDELVATGTTDAQGSFIFRKVPPADGYQVHSSSSSEVSAPLAVTSWDDPPDPSVYTSQRLTRGYQYLRTRDGTLLAVNITMPGPENEGPYPTVVEYSGYSPADPSSPQPSSLIASNLGYAVVGVNMRGTGCSGGAFDYFETLQSTDGYDVIETVAAQPWVKFHKVGMVGLSYPGITQLFVAQTQPPSLAAIAPLSVISDVGQGILYPGGILNNGFAVEWAAGRQNDARPGGQPWSQKRMNEGDQTCIDNQRLRAQTPDILGRVEDTPFYDPPIVDPLSPTSFVHRINVPVYLAGAWQDEQTGGYFPTMLANFTSTDKAHFTITNGGHTDSFDPAIFGRWMEFLSLYVAREIPRRAFTVGTILQVMASGIFDVRRLTLEPERYAGVTTYEEALARFEADPRIRVLFENGAGNPATPGAPIPTFEGHFDTWPIPGTQPTTWYFDADARLSDSAPSSTGADSYEYDESRSQQTTISGGDLDIWRALPPWNWRQLREGKAVAYATDPLEETLVMAGSASVDLWFSSTADDVDVQATISEIRPDGQEVLVQSGWLRASQRKLNESLSTELRPQHTHFATDVEPLPEGELVPMRIEIFPFAHVFRPGSRIRIAIGTPGGTRPRWKFRVIEHEEEVTNTIARSAEMPSKIVLPVIPGLNPPATLPPCPGLRGQPCRTYEEWTNTPG